MTPSKPVLNRRAVLHGGAVAGAGLLLNPWLPAWAQPISTGITPALPTVSGEDITLTIARHEMVVYGKRAKAIGINGTTPGPLLRTVSRRRDASDSAA